MTIEKTIELGGVAVLVGVFVCIFGITLVNTNEVASLILMGSGLFSIACGFIPMLIDSETR